VSARYRRQLAILVCASFASGCASSNEVDFCDAALDASRVQLEGFRSAYLDPVRIPRSFDDDKVRFVLPSDWTSGFVAGSFWYMHEYTADESWRSSAESWTAVLESQKSVTSHHDVGFMINNSFGNAYRLTGKPGYEQTLIQAAGSLLTRFDPKVGAIRSWDFGDWMYPVIIDSMMNLELLYEATRLTGDGRFADAATRHALTTLRDHFRADHSSWHVVDYDPRSGEVIGKQTHQGIADNSAWSRGQAWGLYGFTMAYRYTRDDRFLEQARHIADYYLGHPHLPADRVPYFDFDAPDEARIENFRDSSAAAISASALFELAEFVSGPEVARFRDAALATLHSLVSPNYAATRGENGHFLLQHATGRWQADDEVDAALNYADYYYLEALLRCKRSLSREEQ
jgi:hypothetical protein